MHLLSYTILSVRFCSPIGFSTFINVTLIGFDVTIFVLILPQFRGKKGGHCTTMNGISRNSVVCPVCRRWPLYRDHALDAICSSYNETLCWCDLWTNAYCWMWNTYARCHVHRQTRQSCPKRATARVHKEASLKEKCSFVSQYQYACNKSALNPKFVSTWTCFQCLCHCCCKWPACRRTWKCIIRRDQISK